MSLSALITSITIILQKNLVASLAVLLILLYLLFKRPKVFLLILFLALLLAGVFSVSIYLSSCRQIPLWQ